MYDLNVHVQCIQGPRGMFEIGGEGYVLVWISPPITEV